MPDCCQIVGAPLPYWPGGRCDLDAPLAEDSPWQVFDNATDRNAFALGQEGGFYAEKQVGAVTITAEVADGNPGSVVGFGQPDPAFVNQFGGGNGFPQGAKDANALGLHQQMPASGANSVAALRFTVSVPQPGVQARIIDLDSRASGAGETIRVGPLHTGQLSPFGDTNMGQADRVIPFQAGVFGNPNSVVTYLLNGATGTGYKGHPNQNESSALLFWDDRPWGNGTNGADDMVIAWVLNQSGSGGRSMYDFGGQIQQEPCTFANRWASRVFCCDTGEVTLQDTVTGDELSPADAATMEGRAL